MLIHLYRGITRIQLSQSRSATGGCVPQVPKLSQQSFLRAMHTAQKLANATNSTVAASAVAQQTIFRTASITERNTAMSAWKDFIAPNAEYAANFGQKAALSLPPAKKLAIITCMDARINVYAELGINEGDAHIIRNAGGSAKEALRSVIISQRLLGTREIAVFHHTGCGMQTFSTSHLQQIVKDSDPSNPALQAVEKIDFLEFSNLEQSVKDDVTFLKESQLVLPETVITGWVYEVETGKIRQIV